jgi:hypothetical protein
VVSIVEATIERSIVGPVRSRLTSFSPDEPVYPA